MLFVAPAMPDAHRNGLAMRQGQFLASYALDFEIDLAVLPVAGSACADGAFARRHADRLKVFALDEPDTLFSLILRSMDSSQKLEAFRKYGRPSLIARLGPRLENELKLWSANRGYSLVHISRLYLLGMSAMVSVPCVVDADEDDARVFRQIAAGAKREGEVFNHAWAMLEAESASRMTANLLPGPLEVFTASAADAAALAPYNPAVTVIPNTVSRPKLVPHRAGAPRLLFVGTLSYAPNAQGLFWFIQKCWPRLRRLIPQLRLDVIGAGRTFSIAPVRANTRHSLARMARKSAAFLSARRHRHRPPSCWRRFAY